MKKLFGSLAGALSVLIVAVFSGCFFTVKETEHVIITRFGDIVGEPISSPGLRFKMPFIDTVNRLEKRLLNWDGSPITIPTKDKAYISVDTFARWRITDPKQFFIRFRDLRSAESRLEDILGSVILDGNDQPLDAATLRQRQAQIGLWLNLANPYSTEICAGTLILSRAGGSESFGFKASLVMDDPSAAGAPVAGDAAGTRGFGGRTGLTRGLHCRR